MVAITLLTSSSRSYGFKANLINFEDEVRLLADIGWNGDDANDALFMEAHLRDIDAIILSHSTPEFLGGFVLLCIKFPTLMSTIPVYSTLAVSQLGRVSVVEFYRSRGILGPLESAIMEVTDVDYCFDRITSLKFLQNIAILENRLTLTAYNAGHTLGGSFWLIKKKMEKVVYAPSWNHSKDSFLNGAGFLSATSGNLYPSLARPNAFVTGTELGSTMSYKTRSEKFLQLVDATLANGGAVLLPIAISGRFLELLRLIDDHLANLQGAAIPVYLISYSGTKVLSYASNLLDWMSTQLIKEYEGIASEDRQYSRVPFEPSKVDLLLHPDELIQLPGPKIVFASGPNIQDGDQAIYALLHLCKDEKSTIILTEKNNFSSRETYSRILFQEWYSLASQRNEGVVEDGIPVPFEKTISKESWHVEVALNDQELSSFKERVLQMRRQKLLQKVRDQKMKKILNAAEDESSSEDEQSSSDEDLTTQLTELGNSGQLSTIPPLEASNTRELLVSDFVTERLNDMLPVDLRITQKMRPKQAMFPTPALTKRRRFDEYGEVIEARDYQLTDDNSASNKLITESKRKFELNDKGKWGDDQSTSDKRKPDQRRQNHSSSKLTPQEVLNNKVLQESLDTLHNPKKRMPLDRDVSSSRYRLKLRCGLSFVDLSGLVDVRSFNMIVTALRPRDLVLMPDFTYSEMMPYSLDGQRRISAVLRGRDPLSLQGEAANADCKQLTKEEQLNSFLTNQGMQVTLIEPNDTVQIGLVNDGRFSEFEVKLDDHVGKELSWQKLDGNYKVLKISGEIQMSGFDKSIHPTGGKEIEDFSYVLCQKQKGHISQEVFEKFEPQRGFFASESLLAIGMIRLPELKRRLLELDMVAEFKGEGILVIENAIAVKKVSLEGYQNQDSSGISIDGQPGPLYCRVKKCIRDMLAFV